MDSGIKILLENPKKTANVLSKAFFTWMIELYYKATTRSLETADLFKTLDCDKSEKLGDALESNWTSELSQAKFKNRTPQLLKSVVKTFFWNYMLYGVILFVQHVVLRTFQPVVLAYLISLFSAPEEETNRTSMYIAAAVLTGVSFLIVFTMHHCNCGQFLIGMRVRVAISSLIYRKALKLSKKSLNQTAVGQVVNLLSNDVNRFDLVILTLHYLWIMPFQIAVISYLLWFQVGISSVIGIVAIILLSLPVQGYLGKLTSSFRLKVAQRTDYRITLMSEIISGIQVIKMYAWEKPFEQLVRFARKQEVKSLTATSYLRGIYLSFMMFVERIALFLTIICHVLLGNVILAEQVFSMAQFFSLLELTMSIFYPMAISYGAESLIALQRIQNFLMLEENEESELENDFTKGVSMENVKAFWKLSQPVLNNISFDVPPGRLCAIIGPVGSGKSSILNLLLNELTPECGYIKVEGTISYSSQEPWLFASTVRNNILFGQKYDKQVYSRTVKVCALQKDFDQLPFGDRTMVGERGSALSGGQRARVNLARAVYRQADVYLLDDPLSAVDTHVGKHLFEECIVKYLKGKTRILVTHQLQYLQKADLILVMNEGKIEWQGTYEALAATNLNFTEELSIEKEIIENEIIVHQKTPLLLSSSFMIDSVDLRNESKIDEEQIISGTSPLKDYIKEAGSCSQIILMLFLLFMCQILCSGTDFWLTFWTQQEFLKSKNLTTLETVIIPVTNKVDVYPDRYNNIDDYYSYTYTIYKNVTQEVVHQSKNDFIDTHLSIYIYSGLIICVIAITIIRSLFYFKLAMNASRHLHNKMFEGLLEAPMKFFHSNPSGRILNRFSKDMGAIDEVLPKVLLESLQITLVMFGILLMIVISNYYMVIAIVAIGIIFMKLRTWFITIAKNIKHLEGITKSPVFSHLNSSLQGMVTIRAFGAEEMLRREFDSHQDSHSSAWFLTVMCTVSFGLWLDLVCVLFVGCTCFSFIILVEYGQVSGSLVGLAISQALILTGMLQYGIRQTAEVVNQLTSVERILQYTDIETEGPFVTPDGYKPTRGWPAEGLVQVIDLYLQYNPNDPPVLKNLNVTITPGQKIGVVGRTGAGKSSLITALFRLEEFEGNVFIDGVDTKHLGLYDLRKKISIIPQEPVLFSASLRYNLDPFNEFDDRQIWKAIEEVELKEDIVTLDGFVAGGGKNFSVGQRQLLCLARAILRNNKILVLDEATANIDPKTDSLIQKTIRRKFKACTVLTVAHRLNTVMDSDRILVMEDGEIVEFDHPYNLLQRPHTTFYKMVLETGLSMSAHLEDIALDAFLNRKDCENEI